MTEQVDVTQLWNHLEAAGNYVFEAVEPGTLVDPIDAVAHVLLAMGFSAKAALAFAYAAEERITQENLDSIVDRKEGLSGPELQEDDDEP